MPLFDVAALVLTDPDVFTLSEDQQAVVGHVRQLLAAGTGESAAVLVSGAVGSGKSALALTLLGEALRAGYRARHADGRQPSRTGADAARDNSDGCERPDDRRILLAVERRNAGNPLVDGIVIGDWRRPWSVKGNRAVNGLPPSPVPARSAASTPRKASSTTTAA